MTKMTIKKYLIAVLIACGISVSASAFLLPPGPGTPTVDPVTDILFVLNSAQTQVQNVTAQVSAQIQAINQKAKAMVSKYVGKFTGFMSGIFKKKEKQALPGVKGIQKSKLVDYQNIEEVQTLMYKLFFQYPADCDDVSKPENVEACKAYKQMGQEFYEDTIIELYTSSRELENQFPTIEQSITDLETSLLEGKSGAENPQDENGVWKNAYNAYETMNSILKIIEEIEAMRAQYIAAQAIGSHAVYPATPKKKEKDAFLLEDNIFSAQPAKLASNSIANTQTVAFATEADDDDDELVYESASFVSAPDSGLENPFGDNSADMALMEKIYNAYDILQEAMEIHNQVKALETMRQVYDNYDKAKRLHEKAVESLKTSEQCAINYYGSMYTDARKMWNGGLDMSQVADHDFRKGISGWAVKAYKLAKAEDTEVVVDDSDLAEVNVDTSDIKAGDLSESDKLASRISKDSGGFNNAAKEAEVNESMKESERLAWNIGAEAARLLAEDQAANGANGKWGTAKKLYPAWNDTAVFYNQYLEGKYDNIAKQLESITTRDLAIKVAEKLNDLVDSYDEKSNNQEGLSKLKARLAQEKNPSIDSYEALVAEKNKQLDALYNAKEAKLNALQNRQKAIERQIDSLTAQLNDLNIRRQNASDEKQKAETTIETLEALINSMYQRELDTPNVEYIEKSTEEYKKDISVNGLNGSVLQGSVSSRSSLGGAQLAAISFSDKLQNEDAELAPRSDIRTYTKEVETTTEVEYEESDTLQSAQYSLSENRQKALALSEEIISLNEQIDSLTAQRDKLKNQIENEIKPQIEQTKSQYVLDANAMTIRYDNQLAQAEKAYLEAVRQINNMDLGAYYRSHFRIPTVNAVGGEYLFSLPSILNTASALVAETRDAAQEMVRNTLKQMYDLGDNLYNQQSHPQVVAIHKQLMDKLKELPAQELRDFGAEINKYGSYSGIMKLLSGMYQEFVIKDACQHDYCLSVDIEYFVGISAKRRDFRAPKIAPSIPLPSVRETVFFDYTDYDNVPKSADGSVTPEGLLQNLTYVPEIWKLILTSPTYVEKSIDLSAVLQPSTEMLAGGGIYPCVQDKYLVLSKGDKYIVHYRKSFTGSGKQEAEDKAYAAAHNAGYAQCQDLEISGSGKYLTVKNIADDVSAEAETKSYSEFVEPKKNSELGYLFEYANGMKYNSLASKAFAKLSKLNKDGAGDAKQEDILFDYASLNRNQIGEFLKAVDFEQETAQNMAELLIEIETNKKSLYETFEKIGFTPSSDFDLAKDSDYNLARNTLLRYSNKMLSSAITEAGPAQNSTSEIIQERLVKINNQIKALQKDKDAYVTLGETSEDNAELDESIKTEKTNREVADKYKKQADADFEKQLNQIGNVYCAELTGNL